MIELALSLAWIVLGGKRTTGVLFLQLGVAVLQAAGGNRISALSGFLSLFLISVFLRRSKRTGVKEKRLFVPSSLKEERRKAFELIATKSGICRPEKEPMEYRSQITGQLHFYFDHFCGVVSEVVDARNQLSFFAMTAAISLQVVYTICKLGSYWVVFFQEVAFNQKVVMQQMSNAELAAIGFRVRLDVYGKAFFQVIKGSVASKIFYFFCSLVCIVVGIPILIQTLSQLIRLSQTLPGGMADDFAIVKKDVLAGKALLSETNGLIEPVRVDALDLKAFTFVDGKASAMFSLNQNLIPGIIYDRAESCQIVANFPSVCRVWEKMIWLAHIK